MKKNCYSPVPHFLRIPWWLSVLLAIFSYCVLKYFAPQLQLSNETLQNMAMAAPGLAPIAAILFLLLAAIRLYDFDGDTADDDSEEK
ncbi:MAG: hypothetical protein BA862_12210 [Desulfobulbaceae bacterium S3730MH12]|nr:MAG: hypothetical protein BA866_00170 [Desulfobulbaceae bacterium S5133MH15]OEU58972.1 MAG: hypothetical protein BA862_12210 [Desulfobulbaceae bacterium S3730MH12]OEU81582.1 MAG: hypothetical protein BA873_01885 [Desulfobulbaceae bacterium C00003063]